MKFSGNPEPEIEWSFNGKILKDKKGTEIVVRNATEEDAGQYEIKIKGRFLETLTRTLNDK